MSNNDQLQMPLNSGAVQGEGDYEAARRYRKEAEEFAHSADIDKAGHAAAPKSAEEAKAMEAAEEIGKSHAAGKQSP